MQGQGDGEWEWDLPYKDCYIEYLRTLQEL